MGDKQKDDDNNRCDEQQPHAMPLRVPFLSIVCTKRRG